MLNVELAKFNNALDFANRVIEESKSSSLYTRKEIKTHPVIDVIRILGRSLQTEYLSHLLYLANESNLETIHFWEIFFDNCFPLTSSGKTYSDLIKKLDTHKDIDLSKDLVLPSPWKRDRYIKCISNIGEGRACGKWEEITTNHSITLLLPLGIALVNGGNHSISTGIIQGEGVISNAAVYDISPLYEYVKCDGLNYIRISDGVIINKVPNIEFAAIFEIGRLMVQNSISF